MGQLDWFRDQLRELERLDKSDLLSILQEMHGELTDAEKTRRTFLEQRDIAQNSTSLYGRRCEIAVAVLRDDADGLTTDTLNELASVIWPSPVLKDPTTIPTAERTATPEYLAGRMCLAARLLGQAGRLIDSLKSKLYLPGRDIGELEEEISDWSKNTDNWCNGK